MGISQWIVAVVVVWWLFLYAAPLWVWSSFIILTWFALQLSESISTVTALSGWVVIVPVLLLLNVRFLRARLISKYVLTWFKKVLPPLSATENEALEAGDVAWEAKLFCGKPEWNALKASPKSELSTEERSFLDNQVETLCGMLDDHAIMAADDLPAEVWRYIKSERFFGMIIPKEYGGHGFSALGHSTVITKIGTRSATAAVTVMVPNSLGPAELLLMYGSDQQKQYYLPRLACGDDVPCFALTGRESGSDAGNMLDTGIVTKGLHEGKEIIGLQLNWEKRYITLAPVATVIGVAFKLYDPDGLLGNIKDLGITLALIPRKHPGITIERHHAVGAAFMNGPVYGRDVFIPLDWIIGGQERIGQGWRMLMECLGVGRSISLPALSTAYGKLSFRMSGAYAKVRKQFRVSLGDFEGIQEALGRIGGMTYMLESMRLMSASAIDQHLKPSIASAIAKYNMTEMARVVINAAMDIHAGRGVMQGPKNYLANHYCVNPVAITVEGANILTRSLMIFGQGAVRCHPYILQELRAAGDSNTARGVAVFDKALFKHIGYFLSNWAKVKTLGVLRGCLPIGETTDCVELKPYYRQLNRMSVAFAWASDVAFLVLGGQLKRSESLSGRYADILSNLYIAAAVCRYYEQQHCPVSDLPLVRWSLDYCLHNIHTAFYGLFDNFPNRFWAGLMKYTIFLFGGRFAAPSDKVNHEVAHLMMEATELRDRITQDCYVGKDVSDPTGCVEIAFRKMLVVEPLLEKIQHGCKTGKVNRHADFLVQAQQAVNEHLITADDLQLLKEFEQARINAIQVDATSINTNGKDSTCQTPQDPRVATFTL